MVEVVNSALSLWAKFHSTFPSSKSRSQKWKKVWFSAGRRNDSCSPWRCDVHQGEGEGWRLEWPWTSTIRVCLSLSYPQHFPLPCQAGIAGYHSTRNWPPPTARVHCQGTNITVAWKPKMPPRMWGCKQGCKPASSLLTLARGGWVPWGWQEGAHPSTELWNPRGHQHGIMSWFFTT